MSQLSLKLMHQLYGRNIWDGFRPTPTTDLPEGWNGNHPSLGKLAATEGSRIVIDVGVWKGQSTITMANAMKATGIDGCVIGVDTFLGSYDHWIAGTPGAILKMKPDELFSRPHGLPDIFQTFMSNVVKADVQGYVVPLPQTATAAARIMQFLGIKASVIHVDAEHEYAEVSRDIDEYWKILEPGGHMIGDDYHHMWPGVVRAAGEFSAKHGLPLSIDPPKWILRKP